MKHEHITTDQQLRHFCDSIAGAAAVAFDTEFVSEDTFRPDLCLIQVAAQGHLAVIDTKAVADVSPFWQLLVSGSQQTIVHAGREELRFCLAATGRRPNRLIDVQIAAGLIGLEYPASYGNLVNRMTGQSLSKGETRTDWRKRPLSPRQIEYALLDVIHLEPVSDKLLGRLDELGRRSWLDAEMNAWQDEIEAAENRERWRRVSGISGLSARSLAIVRELWRWREQEAERRNLPTRRVLRDDLIVELARRRTSDLASIRAVRGLVRRDLQRHLTEISSCVERALALQDDECPRLVRREMPPQLTVLGQFLATALASVCRRAEIAPSLVGSVQDVRDLIAFHLELLDPDDPPPSLARGWRAEVVGHSIEELLAGKRAIRIRDPLSEQPLVFDPVEPPPEA